jgi:CHAT domain-containing protein
MFPQAVVLEGLRATKDAVRQLEAPDVLHMATHGFFLAAPTGGEAAGKAANPLLRSGLALSGANRQQAGQDEGILTALEASMLDLWGTKLVTLSACDTGLGQVRNGEGVYGLRRAFFLAGTESVVMSLWPVSDYVTRGMMQTYYSGLRHDKGRADALRAAQLASLRRPGRRHPYYWAGLIAVGEWANLAGRR